MRRIHRALATAALLLGVLAACGGGNDGPGDVDGPTESGTNSDSAANPEGRAFDSGDDAIEVALKTALKAEKVEFDGNRVLVHMATGSVNDPTAGLHCLSITSLIGDDELGFFVYPDGEIDCQDQP